ncbi:cytochrome P450 [Lentinula aff. detonsa]|uniref:Cytochrome P450 n=1 Tax=Lentinula aff. detonsa TaxID=2804958 RepID=A0AA38KAX2_9AGAR|nr:cytochrome P450 [Lentinula aff. detonsa]
MYAEEVLDKAWPKSGDIAFEDMEKLPYLTAAIKESFRLSHRAVSPLRRVVGPGDAVITGEKIPAGVNIFLFLSSTFVHLNLEPTSFYPERWLKSSVRSRGTEEKDTPSARAADINADKYLVRFSRGLRSCIAIQ